VSSHPLVDLAESRDVRLAKSFRKTAEGLSGADLATRYAAERAAAPQHPPGSAGYLAEHTGRIRGRGKANDVRLLAMALCNRSTDSEAGLPLPSDDDGALSVLGCAVPLAPPQEAEAAGLDRRLSALDLLGMLPDGRLVVAALRYVPADARRTSTGDTPLRYLLRGLAQCALLEAHREALGEEVEKTFGRSPSPDPPALWLLASPRYWRLCRSREAQKGAHWIQQLERLAREIGDEIGVEVRFLRVGSSEDPPWEIADEARPVLRGDLDLGPAWERDAGKPKPPAPPRTAPEEQVVEPDLSRPIRSYDMSESYAPGDRIQHEKLGMGVVQSAAGPRKIEVLFGEERRRLIHERP
jgi:hypothetical protein